MIQSIGIAIEPTAFCLAVYSPLHAQSFIVRALGVRHHGFMFANLHAGIQELVKHCGSNLLLAGLNGQPQTPEPPKFAIVTSVGQSWAAGMACAVLFSSGVPNVNLRAYQPPQARRDRQAVERKLMLNAITLREQAGTQCKLDKEGICAEVPDLLAALAIHAAYDADQAVRQQGARQGEKESPKVVLS